MKTLTILNILVVLSPFTTLISQESNTIKTKLEWSSPICISDTSNRQYSGPAFSIIDSDNIIFSYTESNISRDVPLSELNSINIYIRELKNSILSSPKNITKTIYNSREPKIKTDKSGVTHLIWGHSLRTPSAFSYVNPTDVYYSFLNNNEWSNPVSIFHVDTSHNNNAYITGKLRLDNIDRLHLFWNPPIITAGKHFYHKVKENCLWSKEKAFPFLSADYDFIFDNEGRLHMAHLRPVYGLGFDENSVYYKNSDDYGETWLDSVLVQRAGYQRAISVQILIDSKMNIHLIWSKNFEGSKFGGEAIYHSYSTDRGYNWSEPKDAVPKSNDGYLYFSASLDKNDNIHLVYDLWSGFLIIPTDLYYSFWNSKNWSTPEKLFSDAQWPLIEIDDFGYIHLEFLDLFSGVKYYSRTTKPLLTSVEEKKSEVPVKFELMQNYPNPFNPETLIKFQIAEPDYVSLKIYNVLGSEIATLLSDNKQPGFYEVKFNGANLSSGVYLYELKSGPLSQIRKFVLMK